tara:strand:+ start:464 stop:721 length:258 start_codon:yes stop_codon:yes gene_type:complete
MYTDYDVSCKECDVFDGLEMCDNCGYAVCGHPACVSSFPHYKNSVWSVCNSCKEIVLKKFKPYYEKKIEASPETEAVMALLLLSN